MGVFSRLEGLRAKAFDRCEPEQELWLRHGAIHGKAHFTNAIRPVIVEAARQADLRLRLQAQKSSVERRIRRNERVGSDVRKTIAERLDGDFMCDLNLDHPIAVAVGRDTIST